MAVSSEASSLQARARGVLLRRPVIGWAMCDWANSAFATTVMAGFFPLYFKQFWNAGVEATQSTFRLGLANTIASVIVAVMAPLGRASVCMEVKRRLGFGSKRANRLRPPC